MKWRLFTNVSHVDHDGARLWCQAVLVDMETRATGRKGPFGGIRQIRGLGWGGLPVFTVWIKPAAKIRAVDAESQMVLLSHDGKLKKTFGLILKTTGRDGKPVELALSADSFDSPIVVEDIDQESCPFGDEIDRRILPHAGGTAYPRVVWTPRPDRIRASAEGRA